MTKRLSILFATVLLASVTAFAQSDVETIVVHNQWTSCGTSSGERCLSIKSPEAKGWTSIREREIRNFSYIPGFTYVIEVTSREKSAQPRLVRILARIQGIENTSRVSLGGSHWELISIRGQNVAGRGINFKLDTTKGMVFGNAGCNRFSGKFVSGNPGISFSSIASTKMLCPDMNAEHRFLRVLKRVTSFRLNGNNLFLYSGKNRVLEFKARWEKPTEFETREVSK